MSDPTFQAAFDHHGVVITAATGDDGSYAFGRLNAGTYRIKFSGAGFADQWYEIGRVFAEAKDLKVAVDAFESNTATLHGDGQTTIAVGKVRSSLGNHL